MKILIDFILVLGIYFSSSFIYRILKIQKKLFLHKILAVIFAFFLIIIVNFYADLQDIEFIYIITLIFEDGSRLILANLIYIYIKSIFIQKEKLYKSLIYNMMPYVMYTLVFSVPIALINFGIKIEFKHLIILKYLQSINFFKALYFLVYIIISLNLFKKLKERYKLSYSTFSTHNFMWVKKMLICALVVICIDVLTFLIDIIFNTSWDTGYITVIAMIFFIFYLGNYGINQSFLFLPNESNKLNELQPKNNISNEEVITLKSKLENIITTKKPYLHQELTLKKLALSLEIPEKKLSFFLNQYMKISFYDLINSYRIKEFKERVNSQEYTNYSLEGIAYTCGFNSKSTFYRIFKKETGVSPSHYKKNS